MHYGAPYEPKKNAGPGSCVAVLRALVSVLADNSRPRAYSASYS